MDWPALILDTAVRRMPAERREWGAAMLAELSHIRHSPSRWQFAAGCARVALFPPGPRGSLRTERLKHGLPVFGAAAVFALLFAGPVAVLFRGGQPVPASHAPTRILFGVWLGAALVSALLVWRPHGEPRRMRDWLRTFGAAALLRYLAVAPFAFLELWNNPGIRTGQFAFPFALFHGLWMFPTMLFLAATPIVRGVRTAESVAAHPLALALRIAFLTFVAAIWLTLLWDQMPCFLGGVPGCD